MNKDYRTFLKLIHLAKRRVFNRHSINHDMLVRSTVNALYIQKAEERGLKHSFVGNVLCVSDGKKTLRIYGLYTDFDTMPTGFICGDKVACMTILNDHNISVPEGQFFDIGCDRDALSYALGMGKPCVVKPARGTSSGLGVSVNLSGKKAIARAIRHAALFCDEIIIEEFVRADDFRALVFFGKCLSIVHRQKPHITGDGVETVDKLIAEENKKRISASIWEIGDPLLMPLVVDQAALAKQGKTMNSIPARGETVLLNELSNYQYGTSYQEVLSQAHPSVIAAAESASQAIGVNLSGVDIMTDDIGGDSCVINEVNTTPGVELHYAASNYSPDIDVINRFYDRYFGVGEDSYFK